MAKAAVALLLLACCVGAVAPSAAAEPRANVVSWTPNDVRPGEPVSIELSLSGVGSRPSAVDVVIRGEGAVRRFPAEPRGSGRYRADIVFPAAGSWLVRVDFGAGEVPLGKGAICVAAVCVGPLADASAPEPEPEGGSAWWWVGLGALAAASCVASARAVRASRRRGGRGAATRARLDGPPARGRRGTSAS